MLVVGDFDADPGVVPCLAKGICEGRFVDLALAYSVGAAFGGNCVDEFWNVWSAGAEAGPLRSYQRASGPDSSGLQAFIGRGTLQIQRRRLDGCQ